MSDKIQSHHNSFFLTDNDPMPYGKHKGKAMVNVPAADLLWLYENDRCNAKVKHYIEQNMDVLKKQAAK